jgi:hypothetical protein
MILPDENDLPPDLGEEYEAEIHRRMAESDSGQARMFSLEEVMASLRQHHQADLDRLKADIEEGLKGEGIPAEQVFDGLRRRFDRGFLG